MYNPMSTIQAMPGPAWNVPFSELSVCTLFTTVLPILAVLATAG